MVIAQGVGVGLISIGSMIARQFYKLVFAKINVNESCKMSPHKLMQLAHSCAINTFALSTFSINVTMMWCYYVSSTFVDLMFI